MTTLRLTPEQIRWQRYQRAGLVTPYADATTVATTLMGVQAQILPAAGLALWNRTPAYSHSTFESMLYNERTLIKLWGQRGTLHVYTSADWPLLHAARSINNTWWQHQIERGIEQESGQEGESNTASRNEHEQIIAQVVELLRSKESLGRRELRASGIPLNNDLLSPWGGIFSELVRRGYACHHGRSEGETRFVARERWLPNLEWNLPEPTEANITLVRRYLTAYGPGTLKDFAYWRGVPATKARPWFEALQNELVEVEVEGETAYLLKDATEDVAEDVAEKAQLPAPPPEAWPVRLLYRFDPYLLAHRNKDWVVPPAHYNAVWRPAGHIEGIVVVRGQAVGTWRYDRKGNGLIITVLPFKPLPKYVQKHVERRAKGVAKFFNLPLQDLIVQ